MVTSGNYLMSVQFGLDMVEFIFRYDAAGNVTGATAATTPQLMQEKQQRQPSMSPFSQQLQSQQQEVEQPQGQQNRGISVSLVPSSSSMTDDAYSPNPVQSSVGETITWINDDNLPHTVTSGENASPDGHFDSGIMAPAATFEHTFTEPGDYPYFCILHPNMIGIVQVG